MSLEVLGAIMLRRCTGCTRTAAGCGSYESASARGVVGTHVCCGAGITKDIDGADSVLGASDGSGSSNGAIGY